MGRAQILCQVPLVHVNYLHLENSRVTSFVSHTRPSRIIAHVRSIDLPSLRYLVVMTFVESGGKLSQLRTVASSADIQTPTDQKPGILALRPWAVNPLLSQLTPAFMAPM